MDKNTTKMTTITNTKPEKAKPEKQMTINEFTNNSTRVCPNCMALKVISKGKQPKTGEVRAECKTCGKQFALLFSENLGKMLDENNELKDKLNTALTEGLKKEYITQDEMPRQNTENFEQLLRGGDEVSRKLKVVYFSNIKRNRIRKVKEAIVNNTSVKSSQLINIDFAEDNILEIFCWEDRIEFVTKELVKLSLLRENYNPGTSEDSLKAFKIRMGSLCSRKSNTRVVLKRYAQKLSLLSKPELDKELTSTKNDECAAGTSSELSIDMNSDS